MTTAGKDQDLEKGPDERSEGLFVRGTGIRASTVGDGRDVSRLARDQIAKDRDISIEAVYEALAYCQEDWESICREKDLERHRLEQRGFFEQRPSDRS